MPYTTNSELPDNIKQHLPDHAQDIFREAFNNAWDEYADPAKRQGDEDRETVARKIAWSAVKQVYMKNDKGSWVKKSG